MQYLFKKLMFYMRIKTYGRRIGATVLFFINPLSSNTCGQLILFKEKENIISQIIIVPGRSHMVKVKKHDYILTFINVYAPNAVENIKLPLFKPYIENYTTLEKITSFNRR